MTSTELLPSKYQLASGLDLAFFPSKNIMNWVENFDEKFLQISYAARLNILSSIKAAGSGHIGTSFSSIETILVVRNLLLQWNQKEPNLGTVFFSSKGHDAPAIYAAMHADGELKDEELFQLRRLGGLPGHPEIDTPGIPTNTGSLGMGISKAKGFIYSYRIEKKDSRVIVLLGDGELQEGQIWESMPGAARDNLNELTVIVDGNGIQSDTWISKTSPLGDLKSRVEGCGWIYLECNGHELKDLKSVVQRRQTKPTFIFAKTIKGAGINSMMAFRPEGKFYKFHSGSLDDANYQNSVEEILARMESVVPPFKRINSAPILNFEDDDTPKFRPKSLVTHWSTMLHQAMTENQDIVLMDADLSYDTGTYLAREKYPLRYIQAGIAEQDMVSMAGTLALGGRIPIVQSFATFLSMRPTEQIFNNLTEKTRIIYCGFLAGIVPAAPGFSHQAVTDVGIFLSLPNVDVVEPSCAFELQEALNFSISSDRSTYIRINSIGNPEVCENKYFGPGNGTLRRDGEAVAVITSGTTLLSQSIEAAEMLVDDGLNLSVYSYPFLGSKPTEEFLASLAQYSHVVVLENHLPTIGNFHIFAQHLNSKNLFRLGLEILPKNGRNDEVLAFHNLDAHGIARFVKEVSS
jgi:transketolase